MQYFTWAPYDVINKVIIGDGGEHKAGPNAHSSTWKERRRRRKEIEADYRLREGERAHPPTRANINAACMRATPGLAILRASLQHLCVCALARKKKK